VIYAKIAAVVILLAAIAWGTMADYSAGKKAGENAIQTLWDKDRASIQTTADLAIATATKQRDDALEANEVAQNVYQTEISAVNANAADFARRLRSAESRLAAGGGTVPKAGSGQQSVAAGSQAGDVSLTNALGSALAECSANTAQLDALIIEIKPQL